MNAIDKPFPRTHEPSASGWRQRRSSAAREFHTGVVRAPLPRWQDRHSVLSRFLITLAAVGRLSARGFSQSTPQISELTPPRLWQRLEFSIGNVPSAGNPFDLDLIRLDATFTSPSGRKTTVPAFWHQDYQRSLSGGYESDVPQGTGRLAASFHAAGDGRLFSVPRHPHQRPGLGWASVHELHRARQPSPHTIRVCWHRSRRPVFSDG